MFSKSTTKVAFLVLFGLVSQTASAYSCRGIPAGVSYAANSGDVLITSIGGTQLQNTRYCSTLNESNSINIAACKNFYASMLSAQLADREVEIFISNGYSCTTNPQWSYVNGFYYSVNY